MPIAPSRELDSREPGRQNLVAAGSITDIDVSDVSPTAIAIAGNLTATQTMEPGFLQLAAPPLDVGASSSLNATYAGQTIANAVVSPVASGRLGLYNLRPTHQLLDVTGWFTSVAVTPPTTTTTTTSTTAAPTTTSSSTTTSTTSSTTTTTTTTTTDAPAPPVARIAFTRANQIYTIESDGTGELQLTTGDKHYRPRWSPDGTRIVYVREVAGEHSLWVMDADGTDQQQVTDDVAPWGATWSPDGEWLAFVRPTDAFESPEGVLTRIASTAPFGAGEPMLGWEGPDGAPPPPLDEFDVVALAGPPVWSPDGDEIYFYTPYISSSPDHYLVVYDVATGVYREVFAIGGACCGFGTVADPAVSPDGTRLGFTLTISGESPRISLRSYPAMTTITFASSDEDAQLAFSQTDDRVALMNDAGGSAQIFVADADGSDRELLTNGYHPAWQPLP